MQDKSCVYVTLTFSFVAIVYHFQKCYQCLLSSDKVKKMLECDEGPLRFRFIINHLGCISR